MKIIAKYIDDQYENKGITHKRSIVRAVAYNDDLEIALIHIYGDDIFGHRDYLETPGGGVNKNETLIAALERELKEELGANIDHIEEIGRVIDYYNLINRQNDNHYYLVHVASVDEKSKHLDSFEKKMFSEVEWLSIDEAIRQMENTKDTKLSILVKRRELPILKIAKQSLKNVISFDK